jgi:hypothetical protein
MDLSKPYYIQKTTDGRIIWTNEAYVNLHTSVSDAQELTCYVCGDPMRDMSQDTKWVSILNHYYCLSCYQQEADRLKECALSRMDARRKIPLRITSVKSDIEAHRHFASLDPMTRMQYEECVRKATPCNNKYMRDLWLYLFHKRPKPY